jgi:nitrogen fixation protein FixH
MSKPLTGRKVLLIAVGAFGIIIAVNLFMAFKAIGTFPGLEVKNSYVASQSFDADRAAQEALGWVVEPTYENGVLSLVIRDRAGLPARVAELHATVGRTTHVRDDIEPEFTYAGGLFMAPMTLDAGAWLIHLEAKASDGTAFRQRLDLNVKG